MTIRLRVRESHPERRAASICHRRWHERARQSACTIIRRGGMPRQAKSCSSFAAITRPVKYRLTRCVGASSRIGAKTRKGAHQKLKDVIASKEKRPRVRGQFAFLACRLIVVATAFLARDHAAVAPLDRSGHRPAVSPWANGHAAWADADGGV
jgi:hypothetical protein